MTLDRLVLPGNLLDRLKRVERLLDDLYTGVAMSTVDPSGGDNYYYNVTQEVHVDEGPGIDIVGASPNLSVGIGYDSILLLHEDGTPAEEYFTIAAALAAYTANDTILLPAMIIAEDVSIPDGAVIRGMGHNSTVINGQVVFEGDGLLSSCSIVISANDALDYAGITAPDVVDKTGYLERLFICVNNIGAGAGYGVLVWGRQGNIEGDYCPYIFGSTQDVLF